MKWLCWLMVAVFLLAIGVQYNDPDPVIWMLAYAAVAALTVGAALGRVPWRLSFALAVLLSLWGLYLAPAWREATLASFSTFTMHGEDEVAREAGGLFFAVAWLLVLGFWGRSRAKAAAA